MAGAVLGELSTQVSQSCLVAGAVLGEVAKFVFSVVSAKSKLSCRADCGLTGSWQIMVGTVYNGLGSAAHCQRRFRSFQPFSLIF